MQETFVTKTVMALGTKNWELAESKVASKFEPQSLSLKPILSYVLKYSFKLEGITSMLEAIFGMAIEETAANFCNMLYWGNYFLGTALSLAFSICLFCPLPYSCSSVNQG